MAGRTVSIGAQGFAELRENDNFLVDKTAFVRDWWLSGDQVTLVCRPRRFGKTLALDTVRCFLSLDYAGRGGELFGGLDVWADPAMRALQGTRPVVSLSFADCKGGSPDEALRKMKVRLRMACEQHSYLLDSSAVPAGERAFLARVSDDMDDVDAQGCLGQLCSALHAHHGVRPVVLLDEYDAPMQEAWAGGFWDGMASFVRGLFNSTFKTNPALGRGLITGVTRVASESIFSDLNNLKVVTVTSDKYADAFGFTEEEVFAAMDEMGLSDREGVKAWYDGFSIGGRGDIYNPWSITHYLDEGKLAPYWANSSSNALVGQLVQGEPGDFQADFALLMDGGSVRKFVDERVDFRGLFASTSAAWSLLLASGYVRASGREFDEFEGESYELSLVNREVRQLFARMARRWLEPAGASYNAFTRALLACDLPAAQRALSEVLRACASSFDGGTRPGGPTPPERFYHGLVLGMLVDLRGRYEVTSNRESGFGRYDVMLRPLGPAGPAFVLEFKVADPEAGESTLEDALAAAKAQIAERAYTSQLEESGIAPSRIREVGLAFSGKRVLVG